MTETPEGRIAHLLKEKAARIAREFMDDGSPSGPDEYRTVSLAQIEALVLASLRAAATPEPRKDEPTDAEVNAAIDELADRALRSVRGTSGHAWLAEADIKRQAQLLKTALGEATSAPTPPPCNCGSPDCPARHGITLRPVSAPAPPVETRSEKACYHGHKQRKVGCVSCVLVFDNLPLAGTQEGANE